MSKTGTMGNDFLASLGKPMEENALIGLAGDDILRTFYNSSVESYPLILAGGSGSDSYWISHGANAIIADTYGKQGDTDSITLPITLKDFYYYAVLGGSTLYINDLDMVDGVVKSPFLSYTCPSFKIMIGDAWLGGKIEKMVFTDGEYSFDNVWGQLEQYTTTKYLSNADTVTQLRAKTALYERVNADRLETTLTEEQPGQPEQPVDPEPSNTPGWFNDSVYMQNKAAECGLSSSALQSAFEAAGFYGPEGDFSHFIQYGQWEDVSPTSLFDAGYYYQSKAADFFNVKLSQVTSAQAQEMHDAIHNAGMNAWSHYQQYGTREGIDASAQFDTSAYMEAKLAQMQRDAPGYTMGQLYDAFESAGLSAAAHYEAYGKAEGISLVGVTLAMADIPPAQEGA